MKLLERLRGRRQERQLTASEKVEAWVRTEATGGEVDVDPDEIARVLDEAGVTEEDFSARVEGLQRYFAESKKAIGFLQGSSEIREASARLKDAKERRERLIKELDEEVKEAETNEARIQSSTMRRREAARAARDLAPAEHRSAFMKLESAEAEVRQLRDNAKKRDHYISTAGRGPVDIDAERESQRVKADDAEAALPAAEAKLAEAERLLASVIERAAERRLD